MTTPGLGPWGPRVAQLRWWYYAYLALWLPGLLLFLTFKGSTLLALALIPYVGAIAQAYRLQRDLHAAGIHRIGAWTVIVGAVLLFHIFGFFIPGVVLWSARNSLGAHAGAADTTRPAA